MPGYRQFVGRMALACPVRRYNAAGTAPSRPMPLAALKTRYDAFAARALASLSDVERRDVRAFDRWFSGQGGWRWVIVIFAASTALAAVAAGLPWNMSFLEAALIFNLMVFALLWSALAAWFGFRRFHGKAFRSVLVVVAMTLAGAFATGTILDFVHQREAFAWLTDSAKLRHLVTAAMAFAFLYATIVALIANLRSREYAALTARLAAESRHSDLSRQLAESKLRMLQQQIEPHFLFNTLGSAQQLAEKGAPEAARLIADLILFLRASTPSMRDEMATLKQEAALIGAYLAIMKTRLGARLTYDVRVPPALEALTVPPGMVITLTENAIKHGIEPLAAGGNVTVAAARQREGTSDRLVVTVADTGAGVSGTPGRGIGLSNIRERIALLYEGRGDLVLEENEPRGFIARLYLPIEGA